MSEVTEYRFSLPIFSMPINPASFNSLMILRTARSVTPTRSEISRTLMPGVFEIANKTCEWFVRKVQVVVADSVKNVTYFVKTVKFNT